MLLMFNRIFGGNSCLFTKISSALVCFSLFLSACGGGGNSGGVPAVTVTPSVTPSVTPTPTVSTSPESALIQNPKPVAEIRSPLYVVVSGLSGGLTLTDINGQSLQIDTNDSYELGRFNAGDMPAYSISQQPENGHCRLSVNEYWTMPTHEEYIELSCQPLLYDNGLGVYQPYQIVSLFMEGDSFSDNQFTGLVDSSVAVTMAADNNLILFSVPDLAPGSHTLVFEANERTVRYNFTVTTAPVIEDAATYIGDIKTQLESNMAEYAASLSGEKLTYFQNHQQTMLAAFDELLGMPAQDQLIAAYWLQANHPGNSSVDVSVAKPAIQQHKMLSNQSGRMLDPNVQGCINALSFMHSSQFGLAASTGVASWALVSIVITGPVGATLAVVAGGWVFAAQVENLKDNISNAIKVCVNQSLEWVLDDSAFSQKPSYGPGATNLKRRVMAQSAPSENEKRILMLDGKPRTGKLNVVTEMLPFAKGMIKALQKRLQPISGFLPDSVNDALYTVEFKKIEFLDAGSLAFVSLKTSGVPIDTDISQGTTTATISMEFNGTPPDDAQSFVLELQGTINSEPLSLGIRGALYGKVPISFNSFESVMINQPLEDAVLQADFGESFAILGQASHGMVSLTDTTLGTYTYVPQTGYSGEDSFTFVAKNIVGDSLVATVELRVGVFCEEQKDEILLVRTCHFNDSEGTTHFTYLYDRKMEGLNINRVFTYARMPRGVTHDTRVSNLASIYDTEVWYETEINGNIDGRHSLRETAFDEGEFAKESNYSEFVYDTQNIIGMNLTSISGNLKFEVTSNLHADYGFYSTYLRVWDYDQWTGQERTPLLISEKDLGSGPALTESEVRNVTPLDAYTDYNASFGQLLKNIRKRELQTRIQ